MAFGFLKDLLFYLAKITILFDYNYVANVKKSLKCSNNAEFLCRIKILLNASVIY